MEKQEYKDFSGNWMCIQTLGEGAYGEVKLLKHRISGECVAAKVVDLRKQKDAAECVRKEVRIQSILNHPNIIKLYGSRCEPEQSIEFIYLEYAAGGELFNKIDPDIGMPYEEAQNYMKQLLNGVEYLHQKGIAHRDIKPENLLLDAHGTLKIIDFGMATVFRLKGKERLLDKKCGTLPYVAPEVLRNPYFAQPADVWSCGIVLIAMVAGELPWHEPTHACGEFDQWVSDDYLLNTPWCKLENTLLSLARKILTADSCNRPSIQQIRRHPWMSMKFASIDERTDVTDSAGSISRNLSYMNDTRKTYEAPTVTLSQPVPRHASRIIPENVKELLKTRDHVSFSQPTHNDDLIISSQMQFTQTPLTQNDFKHLIRRMTRFFVKTSCERTVETLGSILDRMHYSWDTDASGVFTISTMDGRKMQLIFKATLIEMDGKLLLDFRLSKGCGLEFKRRFIKLKNCLSDIVLHNSI